MKKVILNTFKNIEPYDFSLLLTVFFILIHFQSIVASEPIIYIAMSLISALGILFKEIRKSVFYWCVLTAFYFIWMFLNWQVIDNHMYLWGYCLMAIAISRMSKEPVKTFEISSQLLILFCMFYAVLQKLNINFVSGDFFYFTLITDPRFNFLGTIIQYNLADVINENKLILDELKTSVRTVTLNPGPYILNPISKIITWYVIIIEFLLVIAFSISKKKFYQWQHWLLLLFSSTYFIIPIKGFAFTLLTLGFVLIKKEDAILKIIYILFMLYIYAISEFFV